MLSQRVRFPSFCCHVVFHCINVPQLFYPFIYWWALRLFPDLGFVNNTAVNIGVHTFFCIGVLGSLGYIPRSGGSPAYTTLPVVYFFLSLLSVVLEKDNKNKLVEKWNTDTTRTHKRKSKLSFLIITLNRQNLISQIGWNISILLQFHYSLPTGIKQFLNDVGPHEAG